MGSSPLRAQFPILSSDFWRPGLETTTTRTLCGSLGHREYRLLTRGYVSQQYLEVNFVAYTGAVILALRAPVFHHEVRPPVNQPGRISAGFFRCAGKSGTAC